MEAQEPNSQLSAVERFFQNVARPVICIMYGAKEKCVWTSGVACTSLKPPTLTFSVGKDSDLRSALDSDKQRMFELFLPNQQQYKTLLGLTMFSSSKLRDV